MRLLGLLKNERSNAQTIGRVRAIRHGLSLVGLVALGLIALSGGGGDAFSYWSFNLSHPYDTASLSLIGDGAFRYGPPIAAILWPLHVLPWEVFRVLWLGIGVLAIAPIAGRWTLAVVAIYPVALELSAGNIHLLMALAIVLGFRYPAAWAFLLLTKVTPGIGLLWFAVRQEWRALAIALGATILISLASALLVPSLWGQWLSMLVADAGLPIDPDARYLPVPLAIRLPIAAAIVTWGALRNQAWTVGLAATIALPTIWPQGFALLLACAVAWSPIGGYARERAANADRLAGASEGSRADLS